MFLVMTLSTRVAGLGSPRHGGKEQRLSKKEPVNERTRLFIAQWPDDAPHRGLGKNRPEIHAKESEAC